MWTKNEKKELQLFFVVTFGLTAIMAIFMGIGYYSHGDVKAAVLAQMLYPMVGVILAVLCNRRNESCVPRRVFGCILMITGLMIFCNICSAFFAHKLWETVSLAIIVLGSIACLGFYLFEEEEKINYYKLKNEKIVMKDYVKYSAIFVAVIILSELVELGMELVFGMKTVVEINNTIPSVEEIFSVLPSLLFSFIPSFFIQFIIFWGEEYGWRTFLQPLLQKRFGMKKGIFILGVIWGIWHLPVSMFNYSPDEWHIQIVAQIILCVFYSIFFGYVYLKTKSIWVVAWLHYLNNFISSILNGGSSQQDVSWKGVFVFAIAGMICYLPFLKSKVFNDKSILEDITIS